jgi:hypothetical protein
MMKQIRLAACAAIVASLLPVGGPPAQAIQCVAAPTSQKPWTYRLIDGRKCWYEGKAMISKSLLQWPRQAPAAQQALAVQQAPAAQANAGEVPIKILTVKPNNPLDAQALVPDDADSFEARWRAILD